jgi:hypothetical protein
MAKKKELPKKALGLKTYRLSSNPQERHMVERWGEFLDKGLASDRPDTLDYILHQGDQALVEHCSDRDRKVANTIIQWLATPVGNSFLEEAHRSMPKPF